MDSQHSAASPGGPPPTLSQEQISKKLGEVALLRGLGRGDLDEILRISESIRVDSGEYVFEEGERGDHFFIIVHGSIELRKTSGGDQRRLAVLRAGQGFGEMALLNPTPRSASAYALEDTYLLSVSRPAFAELLGGDSLSVRLLKNLSHSLWATSRQLASQQAKVNSTDTGHEVLSALNRLLRERILPLVTPRVSGYDISARTVSPKQGAGSTSWDWFVLTDRRPAFCVVQAARSDVFSAHRLAAARLLLRAAASEPHTSLGEMLTRVSRGLRAGWVEGLSGPVMLGLVALADGAAEWVEAGPITGIVARAHGVAEDLSAGTPLLGDDADHSYESTILGLEAGDRIVALTSANPDARGVVESVLFRGHVSGSRDALAKLLSGLEPTPMPGRKAPEVSGTVITRTKTTQ